MAAPPAAPDGSNFPAAERKWKRQWELVQDARRRPVVPDRAAGLGWVLGYSAPAAAGALPHADTQAERALAAGSPAVVRTTDPLTLHALVAPANARELARTRFAAWTEPARRVPRSSWTPCGPGSPCTGSPARNSGSPCNGSRAGEAVSVRRRSRRRTCC
ncbi:hypothetical protein [Streptomyces sp. NPDC001507]|uniref:hypothetical protein n=1 Tax=Streptomyces sp. NPDC001507 TaxID=3364579 RepID=UPI0036BF9AA1